MIKYIGSKRVLVPTIAKVVNSFLPALESTSHKGITVLDLFSGTSRVGHALKKNGIRVIANDHNNYAYTLAHCYIQADWEDVGKDVERLVAEFNKLPGRAGYFTETFCRQSRFFHPKNGEKIDSIREAIAKKDLSDELLAIMLVSLMEAADRVDSTTGLQMAYLKEWAPRATKDLELRIPEVLPGNGIRKCMAYKLDAYDAARQISSDIAYLDPPYNQHKYLGNYHIWESLVLWDKPDVYGVACKRMDCKSRHSDFNSKKRIHSMMELVINALDAKILVVSFNNEGYIQRNEMEDMLSCKGKVMVLEHAFKRYVGAQIGIYNPNGDKVGKISHLNNKEYLFIVIPFDMDWSPELLEKTLN